MSSGFYFSFFPVSGRDIILFCYCSNISRLDRSMESVDINTNFDADRVYVAFHDECWGVPVYDDK